MSFLFLLLGVLFGITIVPLHATGDPCTILHPDPTNQTYILNITTKLRSALHSCPPIPIRITPGQYRSNPINFTQSNTHLILDTNAHLMATTERHAFPQVAPLPSFGLSRDGLTTPIYTATRYQPFVFAVNVSDVSISGNGIIDGQGAPWWAAANTRSLHHGRPGLVEFLYCHNISVTGVTLTNSPFWTLHLAISRNIIVRGITVLNPRNVGNTDGIDPDSCDNVDISECNITCGDDGIAIKSGWDYPGTKYGVPSTNIRIRNMFFQTANGVSIGSEMSGGVANVTVDNVVINAQGSGLFIKTGPKRSSYVKDVTFQNVVVTGANTVLTIMRTYGDPNPLNPSNYNPPPADIHNVQYVNITGVGKRAGNFNGDPHAPLYGLVLRNVLVNASLGFTCSANVISNVSNVFPPFCKNP